MTPKMMIEIARAHARRSPVFLRDKNGIPRFRMGHKTDLLGSLIPQSLYYSIPKIDSMNTYELCDKVWTREQLEIVNRIDHIQSIYEPCEWVKRLDKLLKKYSS